MGFFERFWKKEEAPVELPPAGEGVLALLFNGNAPLESQLDEDVALYREAGADVVSSKAPSVAELRELIITRRPEVVHLLASFTDQGSLVDASKNELYLRDLMTVSEEAGVRLFIIASENDFNRIRADRKSVV